MRDIINVLLTFNREPAPGTSAHWRCGVEWSSTFSDSGPDAQCFGSSTDQCPNQPINKEEHERKVQRKKKKPFLVVSVTRMLSFTCFFLHSHLKTYQKQFIVQINWAGHSHQVSTRPSLHCFKIKIKNSLLK